MQIILFYLIAKTKDIIFFTIPAVILQPQQIWLEKLYQNPSPTEFFSDLNFEGKETVYWF